MTRVLFEDPFRLLLYLVPVLFILWGVWNRVRSPATARLLWGGLLGAGLVLLMQWLVVTDREKLQRTTQQLSDAVSAGDLDGMTALIHPQATIRGVGPPRALRDTVERLLQRYSVENPTIYSYEIDLLDDDATLVCRARCTVRTSRFTRSVRSLWELKFSLIEDRWWVIDIVPREIGGKRFQSIRDIPLMVPEL